MIQFEWHRPRLGYMWVMRGLDGELTEVSAGMNDPTQGDYVLMPRQDSPLLRTEPLAGHTAVFREFSELTTKMADIVRFANTFGNLGVQFDVLGRLGDGEPPEPPAEIDGDAQREAWSRVTAPREYRDADTLARWVSEIRQMRSQVAMWDNVRRGGGSELDKKELLAAINTGLHETRVGAALAPTKKKGELAVHLVPPNLLGAMWAQFAWAVAGDKEVRRCATCGKWFVLDPDTARTSRLYCTEACRSRQYRRKKTEARELAASGESVAAIAARLESDVATVQGWLAAKPS